MMSGGWRSQAPSGYTPGLPIEFLSSLWAEKVFSSSSRDSCPLIGTFLAEYYQGVITVVPFLEYAYVVIEITSIRRIYSYVVSSERVDSH